MPYKKINDIKIYYELHGPEEAFPFVLFEGWGVFIGLQWFRQLPDFSQKYRVLVFDNRGAGKTSKPDISYTMKMFVEDAKGLMDSLNIKQAHIFGMSMGGFIAQQFAYSFPEMVKGLVISSTSFGSDPKSKSIKATDETIARAFAIPTETMSLEQAMTIRRTTAWSNVFLENNKELIKLMDKWITENPQPEYARGRQAEATYEFDSEYFLSNIQTPTLILHGENDLLVPVENGKLLHAKIVNSKLIIFRNSPHRIEVERYNEYNKAILNFLEEVDKGIFCPQSEIVYM